MTKSKIQKTLTTKTEKLLDAIEDIKNFLDSTEDGDLASMGDEFSEHLLDIVHSSDTINVNDIKNFIDEEYES